MLRYANLRLEEKAESATINRELALRPSRRSVSPLTHSRPHAYAPSPRIARNLPHRSAALERNRRRP